MEQAIERFKQYIKSRYPNSTTARHYVHDLRQFNQLVSKPPRAVTREDIDRFVEEQLERGLAAATVNRRLAAFTNSSNTWQKRIRKKSGSIQ